MSEGKRVSSSEWSKLRQQVWERDQGICQVCKTAIPEGHYDCGHIIDRMMGGSDEIGNLIVQCERSNQGHKPMHKTVEDYELWKADYVSCKKHRYLDGIQMIQDFLREGKWNPEGIIYCANYYIDDILEFTLSDIVGEACLWLDYPCTLMMPKNLPSGITSYLYYQGVNYTIIGTENLRYKEKVDDTTSPSRA